MIFTSYTYGFFLIVAFFIHWSLPNSWRKIFLIVASYVFYCSWKWQYGFLLLGVSLFNWAYGRWVLPKVKSAGPVFLGVLVNLTPLIYYKYSIFLLSNTSALINLFAEIWNPKFPEILLPLGISFFTFQGIAYLIDVASGEEPFHRLVDFLLFKGFWPQLIAGPIIRPAEIHEQIRRDRILNYDDFSTGCRRIISGLFKKVVLADNISPFVDMVFFPAATPNFIDSVAGVIGFGLQIYFDFSAYSDIAIGTARLFGFTYPENFNWPYLSRSPQEFWNRWHMTLSRWIRDYLFIPLTFAARRYPKTSLLWLIVAMAGCGLWHGAAWTFIFWGLWHGFLLLLNQTLLKRFFPPAVALEERSRTRDLLPMLLTFILVTLGWLLFRSQSMEQAWHILVSIVSLHGGIRPAVLRENAILVIMGIFAALQTVQLIKYFSISLQDLIPINLKPWGQFFRPIAYTLMIVAIVIFNGDAKTFVYFQF
jgi:D-alanyl-lipoteichoic acid acyltransferase DltB (MBOAT superfamily)